MPIQLIFVGYVKERFKDIIFFASHTGMVLQVVYLTVDTAVVQACANLFTVCISSNFPLWSLERWLSSNSSIDPL